MRILKQKFQELWAHTQNQKNPGIKVSMILSELSKTFENLIVDEIRNVIKREIKNYIKLRGSKKTGGYYIKEANYNASCKYND